LGRAGPGSRQFGPPTLETTVVPRSGSGKADLHRALTELAEQDPLIDLRRDDVRQEIAVSLYGEVQKEVLQARLADEYGIAVEFRGTTTVCIERLTGVGAAVERNGEDGNPFLATVGLRVEPAPPGAGVRFRLDVELGSMPFAFFRAVEDTTRGECMLECTFDRYRPVRGPAPSRPRSDHDPLHREDYLLRVERRVLGARADRA